MTEATANTVWFAEEFGLALPVASALFGLAYWRKGFREFGVRPR